MATNIETTYSAVDSRNVSRNLPKSWGWVLMAGIVSLISGMICLAAPLASGLTLTVFFGATLLATSSVNTIQAIKARHHPGFGLHLTVAILGTIAGAVLLFNPLAGLMTLGTFVAITLFAGGLFKTIYAFEMRPISGWGYILFGGLVSLMLSGMLFTSLPTSSLIIVGLFLGVEIVTVGTVQITLAMRIKRIEQQS